jgi:hypothetical protein
LAGAVATMTPTGAEGVAVLRKVGERFLCLENNGLVERIRRPGPWESDMLYRLGRFLQLMALLTLPLAVAGQLAPDNPMSVGTMMTLTGAGLGVFGLGWLLQQSGRPE